MKEYKGYKTIEEDWPRFYREFPQIYDRFSGHSRTLVNIICDKFNLDDKIILEIGCGTGIATLELAKRAKSVIAIEIEQGMIDYASGEAYKKHFSNIEFIRADSLSLPIADNSVDAIVTIFAGPLKHEDSLSIVKEGGMIIRAGNHYRWYGGELRSVILGKNSISRIDYKSDKRLREQGYSYMDVWANFSYPSVQEALETYGFIFSKKAIDYLLERNMNVIRQKARIFYTEVKKGSV